MIKFCDVSIKYHSSFYSLLNSNISINKSSIVIGDELFTSAFVRTLMNFDKFDGKILIDDIDNTTIKPKDYPIAFVPKVDILFENETAEKNILYSLKIRKINKNEQKTMLNSLISNLKLDFLNKKVKSLAPAERKIVALLRAIIHKPKYLLIEDLFSLDFDKHSEIMLNILQEHNNVIITSSNDVEQLRSFDRIDI